MNNKYKSMLRDLKVFSKRLKVLLITKHQEDRAEARALSLKIKGLIQKLSPRFGVKKVKHALGVLAFMFGLSSNAGAQSFAPPLVNPFGMQANQYVSIPACVDIDDDGDLDLFIMDYEGNIKFSQNIGSANVPQFSAGVASPFGLSNTQGSVFMAFGDLDGDGDMDMFAGDSNGNLNFFENTGTAASAQFSSPLSNPYGITPGYAFAVPTLADLDGDGDLDLLMGSYEYIDPPYYNVKALNYFKNIGTSTNPDFQLQSGASDPFNNILPTYIATPHLFDLDNDGDFDLLFGENEGVLKYHENTGTSTNPVFPSAGQTDPFGLLPGSTVSIITSGDLDNDSDLDVVIAEYGLPNGDMKYYRNTEINLSLDEASAFEFSLHPNPAADFVRLQTGADVVGLVEILDINGSLLKSFDSFQNGIDISDLAGGVYLIKLTDQRGESSIQRLVKN